MGFSSLENTMNMRLQLQVGYLQLPDQVLHHIVRRSGKYNFCGLRIPLASNWNFTLMENLCTSHYDRRIMNFLKYGWPVNFQPGAQVTQTFDNHASAVNYPQQIDRYIAKERMHNTLWGPMDKGAIPSYAAISPMSTREKKEPGKRRIITDLSWPAGKSVNDGIPKDSYLGIATKLKYPTIDALCRRAVKLGPGVKGFKKDMERAFCQIMVCPHDWCLLGTCWRDRVYFDKVAVMGCRSAPMCCQDTTNLIRHFMKQLEYHVNNYVDDFMSLELEDRVWQGYKVLGNLLRDLGVKEAEDKSVRTHYTHNISRYTI